MEIRAYSAADRNPCLAVLDLVADRSGDAERAVFAQYLDISHDPYFVMEHDGAIVGCGGFRIFEDRASARLLWGMVRPDLQRQGLGRFLLMFRLREIGKNAGVNTVVVETASAVAPFFEKQGFRPMGVPGQRVELVKKLLVCA